MRSKKSTGLSKIFSINLALCTISLKWANDFLIADFKKIWYYYGANKFTILYILCDFYGDNAC